MTAVKYEGADAKDKTMAADSAYAGGIYRGQTYQAVANDLAQKLKAGELVEIPPFDVRFTATWTPQPASYTVVYWLQNANDDEYVYLTSQTIAANAGTQLAISDVDVTLPAGVADRAYYKYNETKTLSENVFPLTVSGDNSTIVNVYYDRNEYEIRYVYARANAGTTYTPVTAIDSGTSYYVMNNRAGKYLTSAAHSSGSGLTLGDREALTFTYVSGNNYYITNSAGQYLSVKNSGASFTSTQTKCYVNYQGGYWVIGNNTPNQYLNHFGGGDSTKAAGYGAVDDGSYFVLYRTDDPGAVGYTNIQGSDSTGGGYDNVNFSNNSIYWRYNFSKDI